jgi:hypothetical protein
MARKHIIQARNRLAPNGRLPATLRPPIRANPSTRGFAGGRNVVERSERYASEAKPEEPKDSKRRAWAGLLGACTNRSSTTYARRTPGGRGAAMEKYFYNISSSNLLINKLDKYIKCLALFASIFIFSCALGFLIPIIEPENISIYPI